MSDEAACLAADPELFFPPTYGATFRRQIAAAKAMCARCGMRDSCLERALTAKEEFGIWGGLTPFERSPAALRWRK